MSDHQENHDLDHIRKRVKSKLANYVEYNFSQLQNDLLKTFFDLAQEFEGVDDLYRICVTVPLEAMQVESSLYILDQSRQRLELVCDSRHGLLDEPQPVPDWIHLVEDPYMTTHSYVVPIYRKPPVKSGAEQPVTDADASPSPLASSVGGINSVMGMFEISPLARLSEADRLFFFIKYVNRIGYRLHNRFIAQQNVSHLKFINSLVMDIEHNVIIPNMYFKHLFNQLRKKILEMADLEEIVTALACGDRVSAADCNEVGTTVGRLRQDLMEYHKELQKHHANLSLFLESLFRREHFRVGHLVLLPKRCLVEKEIIQPQLDHYSSRLQAAGISVERPRGMELEQIPIMVDIGLLAQVYANLFSNAVKYTCPITDHFGSTRKYIAYGREIINDYFGEGQKGIKFNVFSTGPHIPEEETSDIFKEGYRGRDSGYQPGTGHGLAFVKHVIELHGGKVGYEATEQGNNFYFVLPLPPVDPLVPMLSNE